MERKCDRSVEAKREQALQQTLDQIERYLRRRTSLGVFGSLGMSLHLHDGLIQHMDFTWTQHQRIFPDDPRRMPDVAADAEML